MFMFWSAHIIDLSNQKVRQCFCVLLYTSCNNLPPSQLFRFSSCSKYIPFILENVETYCPRLGIDIWMPYLGKKLHLWYKWSNVWHVNMYTALYEHHTHMYTEPTLHVHTWRYTQHRYYIHVLHTHLWWLVWVLSGYLNVQHICSSCQMKYSMWLQWCVHGKAMLWYIYAHMQWVGSQGVTDPVCIKQLSSSVK